MKGSEHIQIGYKHQLARTIKVENSQFDRYRNKIVTPTSCFHIQLFTFIDLPPRCTVYRYNTGKRQGKVLKKTITSPLLRFFLIFRDLRHQKHLSKMEALPRQKDNCLLC